MVKIVLKLDIYDQKTKQKALRAVSSFPGIASIAMDMKEKKLTVTGEVDAIDIVRKVRKVWAMAEIVSVGAEDKKIPIAATTTTKTTNAHQNQIGDIWPHYYYYPNPTPHYYYECHCEPEYPNTCVIC